MGSDDGPLGPPLVDVSRALDLALDSWAANVQPRIKQVVSRAAQPRQVVADTQAWVKEQRPAAKRAAQSALDHARDVRNSRSLGEASGKLRGVLRQTREVRTAGAHMSVSAHTAW